MSSATRAKNKVLGEENQALMQTEVRAGPSEDVVLLKPEGGAGPWVGAPVQGRARGKTGAESPGEALVHLCLPPDPAITFLSRPCLVSLTPEIVSSIIGYDDSSHLCTLYRLQNT